MDWVTLVVGCMECDGSNGWQWVWSGAREAKKEALNRTTNLEQGDDSKDKVSL
jgi:hypothetical protein